MASRYGLAVGGGVLAIGSIGAGAYRLSGARLAELAAVTLAAVVGAGLFAAGPVPLLRSPWRSGTASSIDSGADSFVRSIMALFIVFASLVSIAVLAFADGLASAEGFAAIVSGVMGGDVG